MTILAIAFLCGILLGSVSMLSLKWNVDRFVGGQAAARALAIQLLRLAALAGVLAGFARLGAGPLLVAAAGVLLSRTWLVNRMARS